ncbi:unnamed protein product [Cochlearia groenlandica]
MLAGEEAKALAGGGGSPSDRRITTLVMIIISHVIASSNVIADSDTSTKKLIYRICNQTVDFNACNMIITAQLTSTHADIATITKVTTKRALTFAVGSLGQIQSYLLPNATDSRDKAVYMACGIAYKAVVSRLENAYESMSRGDYVALKAEQNQALGYIKVCGKKINFFRRTPVVGVNYWTRLMTNICCGGKTVKYNVRNRVDGSFVIV